MKHLLITIIVTTFITNLAHAQNPESDGLVKWLSFKEAQELNKQAPKPFLVDIYTDWCGWCKVMMRTTYSNPNIAGYINTYFYPVKFNAETKDTIEFDGQNITLQILTIPNHLTN
ncbi:MAG: hypothetical protein KatS3mg027_1521 [Bacteroidia bacterium]|nr:MAG: hypothetical protein KatS3mg027_1521 [Bacteroidia bacterium]